MAFTLAFDILFLFQSYKQTYDHYGYSLLQALRPPLPWSSALVTIGSHNCDVCSPLHWWTDLVVS